MHITIAVIRIQMITNIGSFNIGKTVLCRNRATSVTASADAGRPGPVPEPTVPTPP